MLARYFTKQDWAGFPYAEPLYTGDGPMIIELEDTLILITGNGAKGTMISVISEEEESHVDLGDCPIDKALYFAESMAGVIPFMSAGKIAKKAFH